LDKKDKVLEVSLTIGDELYNRDIGEDLSVSRTTLDEDCINQAPLYAWYAILAENARDERDRAKDNIGVVEAELDADIRREMDEKKEKITEGKVTQAIKRHDKCREAVESHLQSCHTFGILIAVQNAFGHRKEMLVTLAANMRREQGGEVSVNTPQEESQTGNKVNLDNIRQRIKEQEGK